MRNNTHTWHVNDQSESSIQHIDFNFRLYCPKREIIFHITSTGKDRTPTVTNKRTTNTTKIACRQTLRYNSNQTTTSTDPGPETPGRRPWRLPWVSAAGWSSGASLPPCPCCSGSPGWPWWSQRSWAWEHIGQAVIIANGMEWNFGPFMHTFTHRRRCQPYKATAGSSGVVRVRCLTQRHLDTRTSNLPVTSQPAVPPQPHGFCSGEGTTTGDCENQSRSSGLLGRLTCQDCLTHTRNLSGLRPACPTDKGAIHKWEPHHHCHHVIGLGEQR